MANQQIFMVFDVESIGLHGEGFAVGYVVIDSEGDMLDQGLYACSLAAAVGTEEGYKWVRKNTPELRETHPSPWKVRAAFWRKWTEWRVQGAALVADCAWPVEARFLLQCIADHPVANEGWGPYPLHELASILLAKGYDPTADYGRLNEMELPKHNPLADAMQSARVLQQAMRGELGGGIHGTNN